MEFGASIFFTDYSISPAELAIALEERGFDSLWAAEHSHIPVPRRTPPPGGGELAKRYYDVMDPFVTLAVAAAATKRLKVATGICLVIQRDTIQTAKLVASIDQVSGGRFLFGIGGGWNAEEIESHGTVFATRMQEDARADGGDEGDLDEIDGGIRRRDRQGPVDADLAEADAEAVSANPAGRGISLCGAACDPLRRRLVPEREQRQSGRLYAALPADGSRGWARSKSLPVTIGGAPEDLAQLRHFRDLGAARVNVSLPAEGRTQILPILDRWAGFIRQLRD